MWASPPARLFSWAGPVRYAWRPAATRTGGSRVRCRRWPAHKNNTARAGATLKSKEAEFYNKQFSRMKTILENGARPGAVPRRASERKPTCLVDWARSFSSLTIRKCHNGLRLKCSDPDSRLCQERASSLIARGWKNVYQRTSNSSKRSRFALHLRTDRWELKEKEMKD